jgi:hypothetical protein
VTAALSKNQWSAKDAFECGKRFGDGRLCQRLGGRCDPLSVNERNDARN